MEMWDASGPVLPGVDAMVAPGHTPGSTIIVVSSKAERALLLGDVVHCPVELLDEEWAGMGDVDPELAKRTRNAMARELEGTDVPAAAAHFPQPPPKRRQERTHWRCRSHQAVPSADLLVEPLGGERARETLAERVQSRAGIPHRRRGRSNSRLSFAAGDAHDLPRTAAIQRESGANEWPRISLASRPSAS